VVASGSIRRTVVFDVTPGQVLLDDGTDVIFRLQTRDLSPTFGSPLGAQLVDVYVHDPGGASPGTVRANEISRFITFSVPRSSLGQPGPGWGFTVVLTGQDGFSPDQARGFAPTPQEFQLGVCATASSDPHCTVDPGTVPKAIDVVTPPGVAQSGELDYTVNQPVTIQGVVISS
jgi:glucoamylase